MADIRGYSLRNSLALRRSNYATSVQPKLTALGRFVVSDGWQLVDIYNSE
jgi:hypothetical protein